MGLERRARRQESRSLLDSVMDQIAALQQDLPAGDRRRLTQYLDDVREVERRIERAESRVSENLELPEVLKEQLKSPIADMRNTGERGGGAITAGLFLSEFTEGQRWVHVDIAGPSFNEKGADGAIPKGGTGYGVATLVRLIENHAG